MITSPLSLDQLTRDIWGAFDPLAIYQLAPLAVQDCYEPRFYKSPATEDELMQPGQYVQHGLKIAAGSLIYGFYLPANPFTLTPPNFQVQITDASLEQEFFDESVPSLFLANYKPVYLDPNIETAGSFPNLLNSCWPVVGTGIFTVEIWNDPTTAQRVQLIFGVLEPIR